MPAPRDILEARDSLRDLLCSWRIYLHTGGGGHSITVGFGWGEMDGGDGSVFLDEDWVFELAPVPTFCVVFGWDRPRVSLDYYWLVVHRRKQRGRRTEQRAAANFDSESNRRPLVQASR